MFENIQIETEIFELQPLVLAEMRENNKVDNDTDNETKAKSEEKSFDDDSEGISTLADEKASSPEEKESSPEEK